MKIAQFTTDFINDKETAEEQKDDDEWVERFFQEALFVTDEDLQSNCSVNPAIAV